MDQEYDMTANSKSLNVTVNLVVTLAVLSSYCIITIGAGHGIAPIGLFLLSGMTSFAGMVAVFTSTAIISKRWYCIVLVSGLSFLAIAALDLARYSEIPGFTSVTAIPFILVSFAALLRLIRGVSPNETSHVDHDGIKKLIAEQTNEPVIWIENVTSEYVKVKTGTVTNGIGGQGHYFKIEREQGRWEITATECWHI